MRALPLAVLCLLAGGAVGAYVAWDGMRTSVESERSERLSAQEEAARHRREAEDWEAAAAAERERLRQLEDRHRDLQRVHDAGTAPPPSDSDGDGNGNRGVDPELWDQRTLNAAMEQLSRNRELRPSDPAFQRVVRALRAKEQAAFTQLDGALRSNLPMEMKLTCTALLAGLAAPESLPPLLRVWREAPEPILRRAALSAMARVPGEEQDRLLRDVWQDTHTDPLTRGVAVSGLALRGDPVGVGVASGDVQSAPPQRSRAVEGLYLRARERQWQDGDLVEVFRQVLRTGDGESQWGLALTALEGFWTAAALPEINGLAARAEASAALRRRAGDLARALRAGDPRPATAGEPRREEEAPEEPDDGEGGGSGDGSR